MCKTSMRKKNNLQNEFKKIALRVLNPLPNSFAKGPDGKPIKCDDEYIAIITVNVKRCFQGSIYWKTEKNDILERKKVAQIKGELALPTIALILESPHKSEFKKVDGPSSTPPYWEPVHPAMGTTGTNIVEYFPETLLKYLLQQKIENGASTKTVRDIENGDYRLVLVNTIQYQCSLGEKTGKHRDDVFSKCFNERVFKKDFVKRLKGYSPSIIINCCTGGEKAPGFNSQIQSLINERFPSVLRLKGYHPSSIYFVVGFKKEP